MLKYTDEQFKTIVLAALEDAGYYSELWGDQGGKEAREKKGYFKGRSDALLMIYGVEGFEKSIEGKAAYARGKNRYYDDSDDNEDED